MGLSALTRLLQSTASLTWARKHQGLLSAVWVSLFTSVITYVCYSPPFPVPEEAMGLNSRNGFTALFRGSFPASGERVNETALISLVDFPLQLVLEAMGIRDYPNYLVKLCLRSAVAGLILLGLLLLLTKNYIASAISVTTVSSTFYWITSLQYLPKITAIALFAGGLWLMRVNTVSNTKRTLLAIGLAMGTTGVLANLSSAMAALLFLPVGISLLYVVEKKTFSQSLYRAFPVSLVFFLVWSVPFWFAYMKSGSLIGIFNYSDGLNYSDIRSSGILPAILGSGYWAESIVLPPISIFGWVPRIGGVGFSIRLVLLLVAILVGRIIVARSTRIESPQRKLFGWSLALWAIALFSATLNASDWPLNLLVGKHSFAIAFREPWTKLMPIYLVALGILLSLVVSQFGALRDGRQLPNWIRCAPRNLMLMSICVFLISLTQTRNSWKNLTDDRINNQAAWMLYDNELFLSYVTSIRSIETLAKDHSICVEFVSGLSDSLRRDFYVLTLGYSKKQVFIPWSTIIGSGPETKPEIGCQSKNVNKQPRFDRLVLFLPPGLSTESYPEYIPFRECQIEVQDPHLMVYDIACVMNLTTVWPSEIPTG